MYDTILTPTDGSSHARRAADHALALGRAFDATVRAVSVVDVQGAAGVFGAGGVGPEFRERLTEEAEAAVDTVRSRADGVNLETAVLDGDPPAAILEDAEAGDADLVVMGTHGRTGIHRYVAGSVTEQVVRRASVPVLTTHAHDDADGSGPAPDPGRYERVLLPTDGSPPAEAAVPHAVAFAELADAEVHVLNVVDVSDTTGGGTATVATDLADQFRREGQRATERVADRVREAGLTATTAVREGFPARDVLSYAADNDVDLVAMGTHGRTGVSRFLLGSTTERAIRHADVPVLAVNTREVAGEAGEPAEAAETSEADGVDADAS